MKHEEILATASTVERDFEALCRALDAVGEAQHPVLLAKLALLLCHEIGDAQVIDRAIARALRDLSTTARS